MSQKTASMTLPPSAPSFFQQCIQPRTLMTFGLALFVSIGVWLGLSELSTHARVALITFGLAIIGWVCTKINDTYVALAAALVLVVTGLHDAESFFTTLGDSTIWLLLASFVIAAAVTASGLSRRLAVWVAVRARSVNHLFYLLTFVLLSTAFIIPATSGRAALMLPVFIAISSAIGNPRMTRALALLFPTIILLSAVASLIGAGAHLVTAEILFQMGGERIGFGRWLMLGLPFALISCLIATWVILHLFLNRSERRQRVTLKAEQLTDAKSPPVTGPLSGSERFVTWIVVLLVLFWSTESLHGINNTLVALVGALLITLPQFGPISFKSAMKQVEWQMLLFMAATLELGKALIESGAAEWAVDQMFGVVQGLTSGGTLPVVAMLIGISLLSHLLITSRTARSTVLAPMTILLALSLGLNPTAFAFISTAAAGFCLTLMVSAKPLALFGQLEQLTFKPRDLLLLSLVLLPIHFLLLLGFGYYVWPQMGMSLTSDGSTALIWQANYSDWLTQFQPWLTNVWVEIQGFWAWVSAESPAWFDQASRWASARWADLQQLWIASQPPEPAVTK
jgi:anion transporter